MGYADDLEGLLAAVEPGEWDLVVGGRTLADDDRFGYVAGTTGVMDAPVARLIVALRNAAPEMIAVVRAVEEARDADGMEEHASAILRAYAALDALRARTGGE